MGKLSANITSSISSKELPIHHLHSPRFFYLITDLSGLCLSANDLFNNKFNADIRQSFAGSFTKSIATPYSDKYNAAIKECVREQSIVSIELRHRVSGSNYCTIYWEVYFMPGEEDDGHLLWTGFALQSNKMDFSMQDTIEKKEAADLRRQSELFFRALIADSLDGILLVNEAGTISFSSEPVTRILGYEPEDLSNL